MSAEIRIPLSNHGVSHDDGDVRVEVDGDGNVGVIFDAETGDDLSMFRALTPAEARALAAVLVHCAGEATA